MKYRKIYEYGDMPYPIIIYDFEHYISLEEIIETISKDFNEFEITKKSSNFEIQINVSVKNGKIQELFYSNDIWKRIKFKKCIFVRYSDWDNVCFDLNEEYSLELI